MSSNTTAKIPLPRILPLGALIQSLPFVPSPSPSPSTSTSAEALLNLVLSFPTSADYAAHNRPFFGETIGRVANRVSSARISSLNGGRPYALATNNGPNCLHGGGRGWGKRTWDGPVADSRRGAAAGTQQRYTYVSADGEEGFPGRVECRAWYTSTADADGTGYELEVEYEVEMTGDADVEEGIEETVVAVTNHSYFNLTAGPTIEGMKMDLGTNLHLPVDETSIPTGGIEKYQDWEANVPITFGKTEPSADHCFIMNDKPETVPLNTADEPMRRLITFWDERTGAKLEIQSTEPAFQLYTGERVETPAVEGAEAKGTRAGVALEPSRYVNATNVADWKGMVLLKRGQKWGARSKYIVSRLS